MIPERSERPLLPLACLILCGMGFSAAAPALEEPPPLPWKTGGEISLGQTSFWMAGAGEYPPLQNLEPPLDPARNAARYYIAAMRHWRTPDPAARQAMDAVLEGGWAGPRPELSAWLAENALALAYLDAAAQLPALQWPVFLPPPDRREEPLLVFSLPLPHLSFCRQFANLRRLQMEKAVGEGDPEKAIRCVALGLVLSRHIAGARNLIEGLTSIACDRAILQGLESVACAEELSAGQLVRLRALLQARIEQAPGADGILKGEKAMVLQAMEAVLQEEMLSLFTEWPSRLGFGRGRTPTPEDRQAARGLLESRAFRVVYPDRTLRAQVGGVFETFAERLHRPPWKVREREGLDPPPAEALPPWNPASTLLPRLGGFMTDRLGERRTRFLLARVGLALRLAALEAGERPATLAALVPRYLAEVPTDPFSGDPLRYVSKDGWRVYSVGDDGKDHRGTRRGPNDPDIVFFLEETPLRRQAAAPPPPPVIEPFDPEEGLDVF